MTEALREKKIEADVLLIKTKTWGHGICIYMYPKGKNSMFGWDSYWQSLKLRAWRDDPRAVALEWLRTTNHSDNLISATYLR
jgi:uncharacterized protein (DUF2132 family)